MIQAAEIEKMSLDERLQMMELLWEDLRLRAEGVPVPQWHKELLDERDRPVPPGVPGEVGCAASRRFRSDT